MMQQMLEVIGEVKETGVDLEGPMQLNRREQGAAVGVEPMMLLVSDREEQGRGWWSLREETQ